MTATEAQVLEDVRGYASAGRITLSRHAAQRARERGMEPEDIRGALIRARGCQAQSEDRWLVEGDDMDGDILKAVVVLEDGLIIVTVF